jgi:hypothetical protein
MNKQQILEKLFNDCNLQGTDADIYSIILKNKTVQNDSESVQDAIYDYIADRMLLSNKPQLTSS